MKHPILGFDPGRDKCGIAIINPSPYQIIYHQVIASSQAIATMKQLSQQFAVELIVMGDGTTAKDWSEQIKTQLANTIKVVTIDEKNSTLEARGRYWQMYKPQGWNRLLPTGLRVPSRPVDDIVAIVLIERYLGISK